ncbi:hypothetical protein BJ095_107121 [Ureibacillus chungkukjangi]|uniref:Uncharacterized protein n=1 Tax=Ureibacillus chungkukjangi TaxID=1202712 RepID=A0A318TPY7_9BACL|nr:hypothetical protein BJ095_107121 [Ureibacillus chungkukjangi]
MIFITAWAIDFLYDLFVNYLTTLFLHLGGRVMANHKKTPDDNLKGTLYATFGIGIIIIIVWALCFNLFIDRF